MDRLNKLLNDYSIIGDGGETIFVDEDKLLDFIDAIRADERQAIVDQIKEKSS